MSFWKTYKKEDIVISVQADKLKRICGVKIEGIKIEEGTLLRQKFINSLRGRQINSVESTRAISKFINSISDAE